MSDGSHSLQRFEELSDQDPGEPPSSRDPFLRTA
jgi:hypothetical protein